MWGLPSQTSTAWCLHGDGCCYLSWGAGRRGASAELVPSQHSGSLFHDKTPHVSDLGYGHTGLNFFLGLEVLQHALNFRFMCFHFWQPWWWWTPLTHASVRRRLAVHRHPHLPSHMLLHLCWVDARSGFRQRGASLEGCVQLPCIKESS